MSVEKSISIKTIFQNVKFNLNRQNLENIKITAKTLQVANSFLFPQKPVILSQILSREQN